MNKKLVYISGYSRSGSTLLDIVLGSSRRVFSTGELVYLNLDMANGFPCTCGEMIENCSVYKDIVNIPGYIERSGYIQSKIEQRKQFSNLLTGKLDEEGKEYGKLFDDVYQTIFNHDSELEIVVDSSKSAKDACGRALALSKYTGLDVYVIHLTRNCLDVVHSYISNGSNWVAEGKIKPKRFQIARSFIGWRLANLNAARLKELVGDNRYMHLKYEDFISDPACEIMRISFFCGVDLTDVLETIKNDGDFSVQHLVGGNRMRNSSSIKLRKTSKIVKNSEKLKKLPFIYRIFYFLTTKKINKSLGYCDV